MSNYLKYRGVLYRAVDSVSTKTLKYAVEKLKTAAKESLSSNDFIKSVEITDSLDNSGSGDIYAIVTFNRAASKKTVSEVNSSLNSSVQKIVSAVNRLGGGLPCFFKPNTGGFLSVSMSPEELDKRKFKFFIARVKFVTEESAREDELSNRKYVERKKREDGVYAVSKLIDSFDQLTQKGMFGRSDEVGDLYRINPELAGEIKKAFYNLQSLSKKLKAYKSKL